MDTIEIDGRTFNVTIEPDSSHGAPWEEEDGHGPVSEWTRRDKRPGERVLCEDRGSRRYYDFAEACRIARRDGWGWLPGQLEIVTDDEGKDPYERRGGTATCGAYTATDTEDVNRAVSAVYAMHRATMSPKAYAAGAAERDFERLRAWCAGDWYYVGVVVTERCACCDEYTGASESCWGIESDAEDCLEEVARDLAHEIIAAEQAAS